MSEKDKNCESLEDKTPGIFSWRELMTQDIEGSKKFYMELFGWTINSMDMGGGASYEMFMQGERPIAGMLSSPEKDIPTSWTNYITVEDIEAKTKQAQELGAHLCVPITEIPNTGKFACFIDPQGAPISFWEYL